MDMPTICDNPNQREKDRYLCQLLDYYQREYQATHEESEEFNPDELDDLNKYIQDNTRDAIAKLGFYFD